MIDADGVQRKKACSRGAAPGKKLNFSPPGMLSNCILGVKIQYQRNLNHAGKLENMEKYKNTQATTQMRENEAIFGGYLNL